MFKEAPAQPYNPAAAQPAQPAQPAAPTPTPPGNIPPTVDPSAQAPAPEAPTVPDSPLAEFTTLWDTKPVDPNAPSTTPTPLDATAVQQAVAKTNFSQVITADTLSAVAGGGEGAQTAFAEAMNQVAQKVMADSINVNNKLTEKAIADALASQQATMQTQVRQQNAADHLKNTNPLFNDPAVQPVIQATQAALMQQFPDATPQQLTEMTQNYITKMGDAFAPAACY